MKMLRLHDGGSGVCGVTSNVRSVGRGKWRQFAAKSSVCSHRRRCVWLFVAYPLGMWGYAVIVVRLTTLAKEPGFERVVL